MTVAENVAFGLQVRKLPGAETMTNLAFGWIRAPRSRDLPGRTRP